MSKTDGRKRATGVDKSATPYLSAGERCAKGRALSDSVPRTSHAAWNAVGVAGQRGASAWAYLLKTTACCLTCLIATDQDRAAIRSLVDKPRANADGSYDIFFGPKAPAGHEDMWVKTIPGKGWLGAFRIYGPQAPAFDGTWQLGDIAVMR